MGASLCAIRRFSYGSAEGPSKEPIPLFDSAKVAPMSTDRTAPGPQSSHGLDDELFQGVRSFQIRLLENLMMRMRWTSAAKHMCRSRRR